MTGFAITMFGLACLGVWQGILALLMVAVIFTCVAGLFWVVSRA